MGLEIGNASRMMGVHLPQLGWKVGYGKIGAAFAKASARVRLGGR